MSTGAFEGQRHAVLGHRFMVRRSRDLALLLGISSAAVTASRPHTTPMDEAVQPFIAATKQGSS